MITLRLNTYTNDEMRLLHWLLQGNVHEFTAAHCLADCTECQFKHLCHDLSTSLGFVKRGLRE